ncbi:MAG: nucleotidyltransferase family protein [Desulfobacterales bacterium]|jgi:GTP:adenosylcobinamide-phosphate guanylyltransferase
MAESSQLFTAIILAGIRPSGDPLAETAGVPCKAFIPVGDRPMVLRVLDALEDSHEIGTRILSGLSQQAIEQQPDLKARIAEGRLKWVPGRSTPSSSTHHVLQSLSDDAPVLVTTADHALLRTQIIDYFCAEARRTGCDVVVGLASHKQVIVTFPETRRTALKFKDGSYCGCNLFGFLNPQSYRAAQFWRQIEHDRKHPLKMMRILGWGAVLRYLAGKMSLNEALGFLSKQIGLRAGVVMLPFPEAAVDVDTVNDLKFVQSLVAKQNI